MARAPSKDNRLRGPVLTLQHHDRFKSKSTIGIGTFGAVFLAYDRSTNSDVAIKKVCLDPHFKNRELEIVQQLHHPNCLRLLTSYQTTESRQVFLHLVTDYFPGSLANFGPTLRSPAIPWLKIFGFQLFAGLAYLHAHGICHRDLKPSNVLVDDKTGRLQLCDFGSAKCLKSTEVSVSYIATRSYRAPELLLDCPTYTNAIDVWAAGCVLCEVFRSGAPLFQGANNGEIMTSIVRTVGLPGPTDFDGFTHKKRFQAPGGRISSLVESLPKATPDFIDLLTKVFVYAPEKRATAAQCMTHPFFAECVRGEFRLPNNPNTSLPDYFPLIASPEVMLGHFPFGVERSH
jgi:glycogen synthase kinase 3 beta